MTKCAKLLDFIGILMVKSWERLGDDCAIPTLHFGMGVL